MTIEPNDDSHRHPAIRCLHETLHAIRAAPGSVPGIVMHPKLVTEGMFVRSRETGKTRPADVHGFVVERLRSQDRDIWRMFLANVAHVVFVDCHGGIADWNHAIAASPLAAEDHYRILHDVQRSSAPPAPSSIVLARSALSA